MSASKPQLQELGDFLNPTLGIPVAGKTYRVKAITADNALHIQTSMEKAAIDVDKGINPDEIELASDDDEVTYFRRVLGDTYQELLDGGAPYVAVKHVLAIVLAWTFADFDTAQEYYKSGGKVRRGRKPQDRRPTATPTHTGEADTTQTQASRSGTNSQTKVKAGSGATSSDTGTP